jgi:NTE family protein
MIDGVPDRPVGLVLAGGGARGAYEVGALSVLLPELESRGQRPTILVGNSVGALNVAFLAAGARTPADELVACGVHIWGSLTSSGVIRHVLSPGSALRGLAYAGQVLGVRGARLRSLLDSRPLTATTNRVVNFDTLNDNVDDGPLEAVALASTSALTGHSVVFHRGGGSPARDPYRQIDYVPTSRLDTEHVLASAAIPAVFPAVHVGTPGAAGWYMDGGVRLNTPIKPAIKLGARRVVVIALSSLSSPPELIAGEDRPDAFAGIAQLVQGMLADTVVQDVHTLARTNDDVSPSSSPRFTVPYIAVAPEEPNAVEKIAFDILTKRYSGLRGFRRSPDVWILNKILAGGRDLQNSATLSLLLFDPEFLGALIDLGKADATRWLTRHPDDPWQIGPP